MVDFADDVARRQQNFQKLVERFGGFVDTKGAHFTTLTALRPFTTLTAHFTTLCPGVFLRGYGVKCALLVDTSGDALHRGRRLILYGSRGDIFSLHQEQTKFTKN